MNVPIDGTGLDVHYVTVDSRARDVRRFPEPNDYSIRLNYTLRDVESIELLTLQMARGESNIHSGNCTFRVYLNGSLTGVTGTLPVQQYTTAADLVNALSAALLLVDGGFSVLLTASGWVQISNSVPFRIETYGSLDRILGFRSSTALVSDPSGVLTSTYPLDLGSEPYVLLHINDFDRYIGNTLPLDQAFVMIPFEERPYRARFHIYNSELEKKGIYLMNNANRNLADLRIRFLRPDGSLYDFQGMDHQIVLRVTARNRKSD